MPHFILDCSENILEKQNPRKVIEAVFETAFSTSLFDRDDIKVRLNPYKYSLVQSEEADFIHRQNCSGPSRLHLVYSDYLLSTNHQ